ncbi:L-asparaginase 1 isoform X1 [Nasonia vitripennis]|uniref:asparaginase n=2 Tax=Nasonia vitripennis TaxID=7425 RepID=A0A7M7IT27_NASVI|nr:L-asparaginase 1 isoform X1 [Nasonia vitripennis]XP_016840543.1 L-asparaginase 1 isoform X1 [Nasonia vitripennis]
MSETDFTCNANMLSANSSSQNTPVENNKSNGTNGEEHIIRRNVSSGAFPQESKPEGRVLVLYTGGTIGMVRNKDGALVPIANAFVKNLRRYPNMHDKEYAEERFGPMGPLVLPMTDVDSRRIIYNVLEYKPLCDSSNMRMDDWIRIARDIQESYEHFDGFVILHGTDTLSYTASALSFMLEALGKIVVLTGSQLPLFDTRSDGLDNFLTSLVIAANYNIPEVCIFFGTRLMRGNRTTKASVTAFEAFHSPNAPPLAVAGIKIDVDYRSIFRTCHMEKFHVHTTLNKKVGLLRLFPSITADLVKAFLRPPIEGVVLQTYGAGNVPSNREDIIAEFKAAADRGVIIINITQCSEGSVCSIYEVGKILMDAGVLSGFDMTPEAALTKLAYVLSKTEWDTATKRSMMETNLRGELTAGRSVTLQDWDLVDAVGRSLRISSPSEFKELGAILFPAMMNAAVLAKDTMKLSSLKRYGADISQPNADGRTALHIACCEGDITVVRHLLKMGANVHIKDRFNRTPLTDAIEHDRPEIIKLLLQCGAHLHERGRLIGERMCSAAAAGNLARLRSYHLAGADLSQADVSGRTALHLAAEHGQSAVVQFLLEHGAETKASDKLGMTAKDVANPECLRLLNGENGSNKV